MDMPNWVTAQRIAQAASAFEKRRSGHLPHSAVVVLYEERKVLRC
jgi:hypothetical protein